MKTDPASPVTPDVHADDLHRLIQAIGGPVDLFASSGGAVNALALVSKHPEDVRTLVAHEPPLAICPTHTRWRPRRPRDLPAQRLGRRDGHFITSSTIGDRSPRRWPAGARPGDVRPAGRGRPLAPTHCSARTSSPPPTTSPTSTPCGGSDTDRRRREESEGQMASRGAFGRRAARQQAGDLPQRPRRLPRRRVRPDRRPDAFAAKLREELQEGDRLVVVGLGRLALVAAGPADPAALGMAASGWMKWETAGGSSPMWKDRTRSRTDRSSAVKRSCWRRCSAQERTT